MGLTKKEKEAEEKKWRDLHPLKQRFLGLKAKMSGDECVALEILGKTIIKETCMIKKTKWPHPTNSHFQSSVITHIYFPYWFGRLFCKRLKSQFEVSLYLLPLVM